ncbi:MAG: TraB/GumN family protein [Verrucomicrobiota bacterium]|nr:TraB/GumN family protein [Verrucomicrobiota bacterium]
MTILRALGKTRHHTPSARAATACVWRVTDAPAPFYLVGTIHALSGKDHPLPKPYYEALKQSQQFFFEVDLHAKSDFGKRFVRAATYPKGDDIRRHIHPKTWDFLATRFRRSNYLGKDFHIDDHHVTGIQELRPWAIVSFIWGVNGYSDLSGKYGVDNYLFYQARRAGKPCGALATTAEHVEVLRGMADIDAELMLLDALVRGDKRRDDFNAVRAGWKRGDVGPIVAEQKRERAINLGAQIRLLDYRNLRWIPKIERAMKSGVPTSIVAATGHFYGPNNVIELLQKRGHKIEQL